MPTYCIGDLHGRYDLFSELLEQIHFNSASDKLYFLGDVIDWNTGGIKILDYILNNQPACTLVRGNHEEFFLGQTVIYDCIMCDPQLRIALKNSVTVYSANLFEQIEGSYIYCFRSKNRNSFYSSRKINKWLNTGASHIRLKLLDAMVDLAEAIHFDNGTYARIKRILSSLNGQFRTKPFVLEILDQNFDHYLQIKNLLRESPRYVALVHNGQHFHLTHSRNTLSILYYRGYQFPHTDSDGITYIYGHDPVPALHRTLNDFSISFDFDYHQIFTWSDLRDNFYYHLDLSSNPIGAINLDDMSMHYVGKHSMRANAQKWRVPSYVPPQKNITQIPLSFSRIGNSSFYNASILSLKNGCSEFLIGIHSFSKHILYTHICLMDYQIHFEIDGWFEGQSFDEIISKVRSDFSVQQQTDTVKQLLQELNRTHY